MMPVGESCRATLSDTTPNFDTRPRSHRCSFVLPTCVAYHPCAAHGPSPSLLA